MIKILFDKKTGYAVEVHRDDADIGFKNGDSPDYELVDHDADFGDLEPSKTYKLTDGEVVVTDHPTVTKPVPEEVPMSRLCIALVEFDFYDTIKDFVYNMPEDTPEQRKQKQIVIQWFERAQVARRDNVLLNTTAVQLGITQDQIDDVFRFAGAIPD